MLNREIVELPRPGSVPAWPFRGDPSEHKRQVNEHARHGFPRVDPNEQIPFLCECERADCFRTVWINGVGYDRLRAATAGALLSDGCASDASLGKSPTASSGLRA